MTTIREAQALRYMFFAIRLARGADSPVVIGEGDLNLISASIDTFFRSFSLQPAEAFPAQLLSGDSGDDFVYPRRSALEWRSGPVRDGLACRVYAKSHDEILVVQLGVGRPGISDSSQWAAMAGPLSCASEDLANSRFYLGSVTCFVGRCDADDSGMEAAVRTLLGSSDMPIRKAGLANGLNLYDRIGVSDTVALTSPDSDAAEQEADRYLGDVFPAIFTFLRKISFVYNRQYLASGARSQLYEFDSRLATSLSEARTRLFGPVALDPLLCETHLRNIAVAYDAFSVALLRLEDSQHTARVNKGNLDHVIGQNELPFQGPVRAWSSSVEQAIAQVAADLSYFRLRAAEAETTLRAIEVGATLMREQTERHANDLSDTRNHRLTLLATIAGSLSLILTFVTDDIAKAAINMWQPNHEGGEYSLWGLVLAKSCLALVVIGLCLPAAAVWRVWARRHQEKPKDG